MLAFTSEAQLNTLCSKLLHLHEPHYLPLSLTHTQHLSDKALNLQLTYSTFYFSYCDRCRILDLVMMLNAYDFVGIFSTCWQEDSSSKSSTQRCHPSNELIATLKKFVGFRQLI